MYAFQLVQKFGAKHALSFCLPELKAVMLNYGVDPAASLASVDDISFPGWPVVFARLPDDATAAKICE